MVMGFKLIKMLNVPVVLLLLASSLVGSATASVSYDSKAITINGQRRILISGSIHYPRSTPEMWPDLIQKAKEGGLDVIQTYVFWNGHEPAPGKYYFEGNYDLVKFIKLVQQAGLYVHLRIGPYVCAEWNFGGFPVWLKYIPGISFRTDNGPFKFQMQKFTEKIVNMMKAERFYESQGGPIILSQIENEYGPVEYEIGALGKSYTKWAADMALGLSTGVPWVMCKQDDAPDPVINTCNGFYCDYFSPNTAYKPKMWTEAWTGWFTEFGGPVPYRPAEDLAFSVAKFIQKGGSFVNYYMYHGGTNFGRTAGGPFIATSYDYDAPVDEYGLLRQPKWGHLKDLHRAIKLCEPALVSGNPTVTQIGNYQEAHVFKSKSGACAAFLANYNPKSFATVAFGNMHYNLPPWSISILPDCKNTVYNTARVGSQSAQMKMTRVPIHGGLSWQAFNEETTSNDDSSFTMTGLLEQLNTTRDLSDYLWYSTDVVIDPNEGFLRNGNDPVLTVLSAGHALHVFVNGQLSGTVYGSLEFPKLTFSESVKLRAGVNKFSLLSVAVGLPNVGPHFETWNAGVLGPITLNGLNEGRRDLSWQKWSYKVGLKGETLSLHSLSGSSSVEWIQGYLISRMQPLTWYKLLSNTRKISFEGVTSIQLSQLAKTTVMSDLPVEVRSAIDAQNPFEVDLSSTSTLSQGENESYEKRFATLKSFEEVDWVVSSEGNSEKEDNKEEAQQERAKKFSNYGNIVLLIFKIYTTLRSGALAITASTLDSVLDLMACFILWLTHISMGRINIYKYPIGKLRVQPVGISIFASVMATLDFLNMTPVFDKNELEETSGGVHTGNGYHIRTTFDAPAGVAPFALDMGSMGKGQVWLNGQSLGRYWPAYKASGTCDYCNYAGTYNENKCRSNCGEASQRWYHVPHSWLKPTGNLLVVFEELGGDPNGISLVRRDIDSVCADIYEWQPNVISYRMQASGKVSKPVRPKAHLSCGPGQKISSIKFASFGNPVGSCGNFHEGSCHAHKSYNAFERNCVGQNWCTVTVSPENFGGDPCPNAMKKLSVEAICT